MEFVNADLYEREHLQHISDAQMRSQAARLWADGRREKLLEAGQSFASETVFSHESKLNLIVQAQSLGFSVVLYVVAVTDPTVLLARVKQRVAEGGHFVPADRILMRYPRTMANLKKAMPMVDLAFVYDAVDIEQGGHRLVALCERGQPPQLQDRLPHWAATLLSRG